MLKIYINIYSIALTYDIKTCFLKFLIRVSVGQSGKSEKALRTFNSAYSGSNEQAGIFSRPLWRIG